MILTRAPLRIPLGGGGTDFPSYYERWGGFVLGLAIDKYVHVVVHDTMDKKIRLKYSKTECVDNLDQLENRVAAEALKYFKIFEGVEVATFSDVPECSGLGGSSSFCVALVTALRLKLDLPISKSQVFKDAVEIERHRAGLPGGVQDQYFASYGGCWELHFGKEIIRVPADLERFLPALKLVYTNSFRSDLDIAKRQDSNTLSSDSIVKENLDKVKDLGFQIRDLIKEDKVEEVGSIFHNHWELKKQRDPLVTNPVVDATYEKARQAGAYGGKLVGIGGGGYVLLISRKDVEGLDCIPIKIDNEGARLVYRN